MSTWISFVTGSWAGPVCLAVTVVGLVLSVVAWRRKGARSGIRGMAWSLLPLAVYLVHALALVGRSLRLSWPSRAASSSRLKPGSASS